MEGESLSEEDKEIHERPSSEPVSSTSAPIRASGRSGRPLIPHQPTSTHPAIDFMAAGGHVRLQSISDLDLRRKSFHSFTAEDSSAQCVHAHT